MRAKEAFLDGSRAQFSLERSTVLCCGHYETLFMKLTPPFEYHLEYIGRPG